MNAEKRYQIFSRLQAENPNPKTELEYTTPFELLIAVMLSAQATDVSVNKATRTLFPSANTPEAILALGVEGLKRHIKTIGLFNTKAENIIKTCRILLEEHDGQVPQTRAELERCPGWAARPPMWCSTPRLVNPPWRWIRISFASPTAPASPPARMFARWKKNCCATSPALLHDAHHWLILHGRYVCTARKPRCGGCVIEDLCEYKQKSECD